MLGGRQKNTKINELINTFQMGKARRDVSSEGITPVWTTAPITGTTNDD